MALLRSHGFHDGETLPSLEQQPGNAARGESHNENEDAAVDDEIEPRRVSSDKFCRFA
jgi:hypothetical protein